MRNKDFFYLQYNKINWENQEKTKINSFVNDFIIKRIVLMKKEPRIRIFDIGFGIGLFIKMLFPSLKKHYKDITIEGCEPSDKNYKYLTKNQPHGTGVKLKLYNKPFQVVKSSNKFDFITAIYVFPHFALDDLEGIARKIYSMLDNGGVFVLVVADEKYLKEKLKSKKDLFIEENTIEFAGKKYGEVLHYSEIPEIGKVIDYNREEAFYTALFEKNKFELASKHSLNDNGFICTLFVFKKR